MTDAEHLLAAGGDGDAVPSHCDFKPENCLLTDRGIVVLDWDESGRCDPRIEAVESALRWAWTAGRPDPDLVAHFARGYRAGGRPFPPLQQTDWAKWTAGLASWFELMAQRGLAAPGPSLPTPRDAATAAEALHGLAATVEHIPDWTAAINAGL